MSRDPSGMGTTNSTPTMSPEWGALEHDGQPHRELSLLSLQEVIVELTRSEDALREHRRVDGDPQEPAKTIQVMHLRARQRVIVHELRRRTRRRARLRQLNNEPSAPASKPAPRPPISLPPFPLGAYGGPPGNRPPTLSSPTMSRAEDAGNR